MICKILTTTIKFCSLLVLSTLLLSGCSYHYNQGLDLEAEERWEEAAIEYRLAFIEDPDDEEIIAALERANKHVAQDNLKRYKEYLDKKQFKKAYRRLEAASLQDPSLEVVQKEMKLWLRVLIAGKVEFEFDRLQANLRLSEKMELQILINTPVGKVLTAPISNDNGIFFVEDLIYRQPTSFITQYSVNTIGLKLQRKTVEGFTRKNFKKFINFRGINASQVLGDLAASSEGTKSVLEHRPLLLSASTASVTRWFPPRLVRYHLSLENQSIKVVSPSKRLEFVPEVLYVNRDQQRVFVDFGVYHLQLDTKLRKWSIQRQVYKKPQQDYFYQFAQNLALNPYFFYKDGAYRYILAP